MAKSKKRGDKKDRHHRLCKSNGGDNSDYNISIVSQKKHRAWHALFGNKDPQEICDEINALWLEREWVMYYQNQEFKIRRES